MKIKIRETNDRTGEAVTVYHGDQIGQFPSVSAMYLRVLSVLVDKGWSNGAPFSFVSNGHKVIWGENSTNEPMGGIIYEYNQVNKQGWIMLSFTDEKFRGRGVHNIIQRSFEDEIIRLGGTSIASLVHKDNAVRLKVAERQGMHPQYYRMYKDLTPDLPARKESLAAERGKTWEQLSFDHWISQTIR